MKIIAIALTLLFYSVSLFSEESKEHNFVPSEGYIPNEETAINVAIAVWSPIYGAENIKNKAPFKAVLNDNIWVVTGSLPSGYIGGVPVIEINKNTGQINRVSHGQ